MQISEKMDEFYYALQHSRQPSGSLVLSPSDTTILITHLSNMSHQVRSLEQQLQISDEATDDAIQSDNVITLFPKP